MISPPSTYLLSALVWQPEYAPWSDGRKELGSYVVPDDSDCSRRSFSLAGWSEKQNAYYYVPDSPGCSLVYQREGYSNNWRYLRRLDGQPTDEQNPRFFLHDDGTFAFSKYRFPPEDPVKIWRTSTGPPFKFFQTDEKDVTPAEFFHDDVQLNMPDLPGQPYAGAKYLPFPEADEYGYDSDASDSSLESRWYTRWARDIKWGQESGLAIGSTRRIIWQGEHWGIEFNLEPVTGQLEFREHSEDCSIRTYMVRATVLRVFVTRAKVESDANAQDDDGSSAHSSETDPPGSSARVRDSADDLATRLSAAHLH